jgi:hypothetical protein
MWTVAPIMRTRDLCLRKTVLSSALDQAVFRILVAQGLSIEPIAADH